MDEGVEGADQAETRGAGGVSPWLCPNGTCAHPAFLHDRYDDEDPYPTCCAEGCRCGHPGEATFRRDTRTGSVTVIHADPVITVTREVWDEMGWTLDEVFSLDTAGQHRYQYLRPADRGVIIGRVKEATT